MIESNKEVWTYISGINFEDVGKRIGKLKPSWPNEQIELAIKSYRYYLFICRSYPTQEHSPHWITDEVWHNHILFTKCYIEDCDKIFGEYFHHTPVVANGTTERKVREGAYDNTRRHSILIFGNDADPEVLLASYSRI
jgi:hypothetical protein